MKCILCFWWIMQYNYDYIHPRERYYSSAARIIHSLVIPWGGIWQWRSLYTTSYITQLISPRNQDIIQTQLLSSHKIYVTLDSWHSNTCNSNCLFNILFRLATKKHQGSGDHFTNNFSITIQKWWKFHFALIQILIKWSLQNLAHGTTAGLSWHVPNFVVIWSPLIKLELNEISIEFELW